MCDFDLSFAVPIHIISAMDQTRSKHPSFLNRPTPTLQLMANLSKFQGKKTDEINQRAFNVRAEAVSPAVDAHLSLPHHDLMTVQQPEVDVSSQPTINQLRVRRFQLHPLFMSVLSMVTFSERNATGRSASATTKK